MITLMKLERSLSSKQLVRSRAAASCPTQPCRQTRPSPTRATSGPAIGMTWRRGSGPGWAVEQSLRDGPPRGGGLSEPQSAVRHPP